MARNLFAGGPADFLATIGPGGTVRATPGTITVWDAETDGTQYTDLLVGGLPVTQIVVDRTGQVPAFEGPDGVEEVWLDGGGESRARVAIIGPQGQPGQSAYDLAVAEGFEGTEEEWLESLAGADGDDGLSAYEVAVEDGFEGTEEQWLASLVGPQGPSGGDPKPFVVDTLNGGTYVLDPAEGVDYSLTLTANSALSATVLPEGTMLYVEVAQDATGGHTLGLPSAWSRVGNIDLDTSANAVDILTIWRTPRGTLVKQVTDLTPIVAPWTPDTLGDKIAWFDAARLAGDPDDAVDFWPNQWADASLSQVAAAPAPTLQIVNGVNVVRFDGANGDAMYTSNTPGTSNPWSSSKSQPVTYGMVIKVTGATPSGTCPIIGGRLTTSTSDSHSIYVDGSDTGPWSVNAGTAHTDGSNNIPTEFMSVIVKVDGASTFVRVNGLGFTRDGGSQPTTGMTVGQNTARTRNTSMDIAEMVIVNQAVSGAAFMSLESYLMQKRDLLNGA